MKIRFLLWAFLGRFKYIAMLGAHYAKKSVENLSNNACKNKQVPCYLCQISKPQGFSVSAVSEENVVF